MGIVEDGHAALREAMRDRIVRCSTCQNEVLLSTLRLGRIYPFADTEGARMLCVNCQQVAKRQRVERAIARRLYRELSRAGWTVSYIDDGGDDYIRDAKREREVLAAQFEVDEIRIYWTKDGIEHGIYLVNGNDGPDVISDWSFTDGDPDGFNAILESVCEYAETFE